MVRTADRSPSEGPMVLRPLGAQDRDVPRSAKTKGCSGSASRGVWVGGLGGGLRPVRGGWAGRRPDPGAGGWTPRDQYPRCAARGGLVKPMTQWSRPSFLCPPRVFAPGTSEQTRRRTGDLRQRPRTERCGPGCQVSETSPAPMQAATPGDGSIGQDQLRRPASLVDDRTRSPDRRRPGSSLTGVAQPGPVPQCGHVLRVLTAVSPYSSALTDGTCTDPVLGPRRPFRSACAAVLLDEELGRAHCDHEPASRPKCLRQGCQVVLERAESQVSEHRVRVDGGVVRGGQRRCPGGSTPG